MARVTFSNKETRLVELIAQGLNSTEIGAEMELTPRTVEIYRAKLLRKTNCKNAAHLVSFCYLNSTLNIGYFDTKKDYFIG